MARKSSPERLAEFKAHLDFLREMLAFLGKSRPGGAWDDAHKHIATGGERMLSEGLVTSQVMTGWKQATADLLEATRDLPPDAVAAADESLVAAGALSLTEMRRRVWRVVPKVLARGRIRTIDEFYVVKNVLDDNGDDLSEGDRTRLNEMRAEFEFRSPPGRRVSRLPRTRPRTRRGTASGPKQLARVPSPSGWCEAYIVEWGDDNSQVMLEFDGGACGSGAVSAFGKGPGLQLRWLDPTTVEVQHSAGVKMDRNASGEVIQCGGPHRRVRVVLKPV
jgi:hypothetical protein